LDYAGHLRQQVEQGAICIATAQNRLSSVNRTMAALRDDQYVKVPSPSKALGMRRTSVRRSVPQGQDRELVKRIVDALCGHQQPRAAAIAQLARATGMRLREAILADLPRLQREAEHYDKINIQDGTKGGRGGATAPRWIRVDDHIREALRYAEQVSPDGSRSLLAPDESYLDFQQGIVRPARDILHKQSLKGFHELRAAYACDAMSKSPIVLRPSTAATATSSADALIRRPECKSAISWGTAVSTWCRLTLVGEHEQGIRYGAVLGGRPDRVTYHTPTPPSLGEDYPNSNL
jgi:integrase